MTSRRPATAVAQQPDAVAIRGSMLYVADGNALVVRALDLATGGEPVVAGTGSALRSLPPPADDGRRATEVTLGLPAGLAVGGTGDLYVADSLYAKVRKVDGTGRITTVAGTGTRGSAGDGGPAVAAELGSPKGLAVDSSGNVYVADVGEARVRRIDAAGTITTVAGNGSTSVDPIGDGGPATNVGLSPESIAVDGSGNLFVADRIRGRVRKVDRSGTITTVAGGGSSSPDNGTLATAARFSDVSVVATGPGEVLYLGNGSQVRTVDSAGIIRLAAGRSPSIGPPGDGGPATDAVLSSNGLAVDPLGGFYVADATNFRVRRVDAAGVVTTVAGNGTRSFSGDGGPAAAAQLVPSDIALGPAGSLYISDAANDRVRVVAPSGVITTVAGNGGNGPVGDGGAATAAVLNDPAGIAVDAGGNLYVAETSGGRVRRVDAAGVITTVAGGGTGSVPDGGPATAGSLLTPTGLAIGTRGELLIAEANARRIRSVDRWGTISTVAGNGTEGSAGDGGPAIKASFRYPRSVAVTPAGELLITDVLGGRVRKVDRFGTISALAGNGSWGFGGDWGVATEAALYLPAGRPPMLPATSTWPTCSTTASGGSTPWARSPRWPAPARTV